MGGETYFDHLDTIYYDKTCNNLFVGGSQHQVHRIDLTQKKADPIIYKLEQIDVSSMIVSQGHLYLGTTSYKILIYDLATNNQVNSVMFLGGVLKMIELKYLGKIYLMICTWYDSIIGVLDTQNHEVIIKVQLSESKLNRDICPLQSVDASFAVAVAKGFVVVKCDIENLNISMGETFYQS